jgi:drug/metabolite transporter (DMT)-like permease
LGKTLILVVIAVVIGGTGHVMLSKGMRAVGDLTEAPATRVGGMVAAALSNPWLVLGVTLQATFFAMYLTLLSRADVSQVLPMTALDYVVVALLAQLLIDEVITPARWGGIALIIVGVLLVSRT